MLTCIVVFLQVPEKAKHYGLARKLDTPIDPSKDTLVLQYDVKLNDGLNCGGAYLKFLTNQKSFSSSDLRDDSPYTIMFGPDVCNGVQNRVHLIIRHQDQKTKKIEEKHMNFPPAVPSNDDLSHVYTAIIHPSNNTFALLIDGEEKRAGSLFEDFTPSFVPPTEIDDPEDSKPSDWVEEAKIADPDASKPDDWDEDAPEFIPDTAAVKPEGWLDDEPAEIDDPEASKPEDWDDEEDGEWAPPTMPNPKCKEAVGCGEWVRPTMPNPDYKGKWSAPMIDNPAYKGVWKPRQIANPFFFNDTEPMAHIGEIGAVAIEIWTMDENYFFDNILITNSVEEAAEVRATTWEPKHTWEKETAEKRDEEKVKENFVDTVNESTVYGRFRKRVIIAIESFFDSKLLIDHADKLWAVRDTLVEYPIVALAVFVGAVALILTPIVMNAVGKQVEAVKVGEAKKNDATPADAIKKAAGAGAGASNGKQKEEIEEEDEEEEEGASPSRANIRRRARRD